MNRLLHDIEQAAEVLSSDPSSLLARVETGKAPRPWQVELGDDLTPGTWRWPSHVLEDWVRAGMPAAQPMNETEFLRMRRDIAAGVLARRMDESDKRSRRKKVDGQR